MAHAESVVPEPGTYGSVLRRYDYDPVHAHQQRFVGYDVNLRAVAAEMAGKVAMTLFFPKGKGNSVGRAVKLGWIDCTQAWNESLGAPSTDGALQMYTEEIHAMKWLAFQSHGKECGIEQGKRDVMTRDLIAAKQRALEA